MNTSSFSTEKLIRLAFEYRLLSDYRMMPRRIELYQGDTLFAFDPEEARFFLQGLLRGYEEYNRQSDLDGSASIPAAA
jgi:hypothetical protein